VPRIAVTATATEQTRAEIVARSSLGGARQFVASFDRPNIQYRIEPKNEPRRQLSGCCGPSIRARRASSTACPGPR
jgi:Superfamily II DNA helicase